MRYSQVISQKWHSLILFVRNYVVYKWKPQIRNEVHIQGFPVTKSPKTAFHNTAHFSHNQAIPAILPYTDLYNAAHLYRDQASQLRRSQTTLSRQCFSKDLQTGCPKLAIFVKYWASYFSREHKGAHYTHITTVKMFLLIYLK